jgi:hypothetical protein
MLNQMMISYTLQDDDTLVESMKQYGSYLEATDRLFKLL